MKCEPLFEAYDEICARGPLLSGDWRERDAVQSLGSPDSRESPTGAFGSCGNSLCGRHRVLVRRLATPSSQTLHHLPCAAGRALLRRNRARSCQRGAPPVYLWALRRHRRARLHVGGPRHIAWRLRAHERRARLDGRDRRRGPQAPPACSVPRTGRSPKASPTAFWSIPSTRAPPSSAECGFPTCFSRETTGRWRNGAASRACCVLPACAPTCLPTWSFHPLTGIFCKDWAKRANVSREALSFKFTT